MLWQADFSSKSKHALGLRSTTLPTALAWASAIPLVAVPLLWLPNIEEIQISPLCGTLTAAGDQPICYRENYRFAQRIPGRTTLQRACESLLVFPLVLPPALKNSWKGSKVRMAAFRTSPLCCHWFLKHPLSKALSLESGDLYCFLCIVRSPSI